MKNRIVKKLKELEGKEDIRILLAVESGSRAWGFASKDSDYDVRFIYIHQPNWYLALENKKDTIEFFDGELLDFSGWDLQKALKLFRKSNPSLMEWIVSPIVYLENEAFVQRLRELQTRYFSSKSCIYHYLHMANGNFKSYLQGDHVRIKKYFYVLRPLLACEWIVRFGTMPPLSFEALLKEGVDDEELMQEIQVLLQRKKIGEELDLEPRIGPIHSFLENRIAFFQSYVSEMAASPPIDFEVLNEVFLEFLRVEESH